MASFTLQPLDSCNIEWFDPLKGKYYLLKLEDEELCTIVHDQIKSDSSDSPQPMDVDGDFKVPENRKISNVTIKSSKFKDQDTSKYQESTSDSHLGSPAIPPAVDSFSNEGDSGSSEMIK